MLLPGEPDGPFNMGRHHDCSSALKDVSAWDLVLHGKEHLPGEPVVRASTEACPNGRIQMVEKAGPCPFYERPAALAEAVMGPEGPGLGGKTRSSGHQIPVLELLVIIPLDVLKRSVVTAGKGGVVPQSSEGECEISMGQAAVLIGLFLGLWGPVSLILSLLGGWRELAGLYRTDRVFRGRKRNFLSAKMKPAHDERSLILGADRGGLYLSVIFPFRLGHPPLYISWEEIRIHDKNMFSIFREHPSKFLIQFRWKSRDCMLKSFQCGNSLPVA